jgi:hypothetical protein
VRSRHRAGAAVPARILTLVSYTPATLAPHQLAGTSLTNPAQIQATAKAQQAAKNRVESRQREQAAAAAASAQAAAAVNEEERNATVQRLQEAVERLGFQAEDVRTDVGPAAASTATGPVTPAAAVYVGPGA